MTTEQRKAFAQIFRRLAKYMADMPALITLLDAYEKSKMAPENWRDEWRKLRETSEYKAAIQDFEPVIAMFESSSEQTELIRLLQQISDGQLPN
jgi:hypothetical protein